MTRVGGHRELQWTGGYDHGAQSASTAGAQYHVQGGANAARHAVAQAGTTWGAESSGHGVFSNGAM